MRETRTRCAGDIVVVVVIGLEFVADTVAGIACSRMQMKMLLQKRTQNDEHAHFVSPALVVASCMFVFVPSRCVGRQCGVVLAVGAEKH